MLKIQFLFNFYVDMSKEKSPSTMEKAPDSKTKAPDTIKVVTLVFLQPLPSVIIPEELCIYKYHCFIKDLPANLSLEQYMQAVKAAVTRRVPYNITWDQFTVYVELNKDRGKKIFDFKHPYTVDESWDMTLKNVYEESQIEKAKLLNSTGKQETEDDAAVEESSSSENLDKIVETATEDVTDVQSMVESNEQRVCLKIKKISENVFQNVSQIKLESGRNEKKEFKGRKRTRKDFDEIVGKNLILRVYGY